MTADCVSVIEAARRIEASDDDWLRGLGESARRASPLFENAFCFLYDARDVRAVRILAGSAIGDKTALELVGRTNAAASPEAVVQAYVSRPVDTVSGILGTEYQHDPITALLADAGYADVLGVVGGDATGFGCLLGSLLHKRTRVARETRHQWSRVAAHIATASRMRREMSGSVLENAEAVFDESGRLQQQRSELGSKDKEALRHAARQADRARGSMRRRDQNEAIDIWEAMVAGRWSLVDTFDTDGRRFFVARGANPTRDTPAQLSQRERQVAALSALGHPGKLIAYELGLSPSTVSTHLSNALAKLGLSNRAELVGYFMNPLLSPHELGQLEDE